MCKDKNCPFLGQGRRKNHVLVDIGLQEARLFPRGTIALFHKELRRRHSAAVYKLAQKDVVSSGDMQAAVPMGCYRDTEDVVLKPKDAAYRKKKKIEESFHAQLVDMEKELLKPPPRQTSSARMH